jgi:hypothetical protein
MFVSFSNVAKAICMLLVTIYTLSKISKVQELPDKAYERFCSLLNGLSNLLKASREKEEALQGISPKSPTSSDDITFSPKQ